MSRLFNITTDTVRLYSNIGLLRPKKNIDTNYRIYKREDVFDLEYILRLREMGFSLKEIESITGKNSVDETILLLDCRLQEILEKMKDLERTFRKIQEYRSDLMDIAERESQFSIVSTCFLILYLNSPFQEGIKRFKEVSKGIQPKMTFFFPSADLETEKEMKKENVRQEIDFALSCMIDEEFVLDADASPLFSLIGPSKFLHVVSAVKPGMDYSFWNEIETYIAQHHLVRDGISLSQYIGSMDIRHQATDYYNVYIPIK